MAETKKPAAKSAAVKKTTATKTATKSAPKAEEVKKAAPKAEVKEAPKAAPAKKASKGAPKRAVTTRLLEKYNNEIKKALIVKYNYKSVMQAPKLEKIVINVGVGEALTNNKAIDEVVNEIGLITGQHPVTTKAKKSIATFKLREGHVIGVKVTLQTSVE